MQQHYLYLISLICLSFFLFTYFWISDGVIPLSLIENLIKSECLFFFLFLWCQYVQKISFHICKNLLRLLVIWNSFFTLYRFSLISIFIYALSCLNICVYVLFIKKNVFMYQLWWFCLREVLYFLYFFLKSKRFFIYVPQQMSLSL